MSGITACGIGLGLIFAVIGYKRGLYTMWAVMFNVIVSIYVAVMLTPTLASQFGWIGSEFSNPNKQPFWYAYAITVAGTAVLVFFILETIALTYFLGTFNISLPKILNVLGSPILGFITGYIIWGFICFTVLIIPNVQDSLVTSAFAKQDARDKLSVPAISKVINTANAFSMQPDMKKVNHVINWTLGWNVVTEDVNTPPKKKAAPKKKNEPVVPEEVQVES